MINSLLLISPLQSDRVSTILSAQLTIITSITFSTAVNTYAWSPDGAKIAFLLEKSQKMAVYDVQSNETTYISLSTKYHTSLFYTCIGWSLCSRYVCIGTGKGSLCMVDMDTKEPTCIMGKSGKSITNIHWLDSKSYILITDGDKVVFFNNNF